jgi:hypothetical protein
MLLFWGGVFFWSRSVEYVAYGGIYLEFETWVVTLTGVGRGASCVIGHAANRNVRDFTVQTFFPDGSLASQNHHLIPLLTLWPIPTGITKSSYLETDSSALPFEMYTQNY